MAGKPRGYVRPPCSIEGCDAPASGRGWCALHYARWHRLGDPLAEVAYQAPRGARCTVEGCGAPVIGRGWCGMHYKRWQIHGDPLKGAAPVLGASSCSIEGCDAPADSRGWCALHYERWRKNGDPLYERVRVRLTCSIEGCERPYGSRGWCRMHLARWRRHGDPLVSRLCRDGSRRCEVEGCDRPHAANGLCRSHYAIERDDYRRHTAALLEAAGGLCSLCGEAIDSRPSAPIALRPSVDHIEPVSAGGTDELANLRIAHRSCNSARNNRADVHEVAPPWSRRPELAA
jgi:5-methylcytosine-specific restriction endonuclease McrA